MSSIRSRAPAAASPAVRKVMVANVGRERRPERRLRSLLHRAGLRFRKDSPPEEGVRCRADIVFRRPRVCVFVDGCFWHGCPRHFRLPKTNSEWWAEKIRDNMERDVRKTGELQDRGWEVIRVWEHDVAGSRDRVAAVVQAVKRVCEERRPQDAKSHS